MKRLLPILVCLAMLPFIVPIGAEEEKPPLQVAIYPFDGVGVDATLATIISNTIYRELIKSKKILVRDQNSTTAAIKELGMAQTGYCADDACKIEVGKIIKAQKLVMGTIEKLDENYYTISIRVVDVQTGASEYQTQQDCNCAKNIEIRDFAIKLTNSTILVYLETGEKPAAPQISVAPPAATPAPPPPTPPVPAPATSPTEDAIKLFSAALESGDMKSAARFIFENPALTNTTDNLGTTPLHYAAMSGDLAFAELLIQNGVDINRKTQYEVRKAAEIIGRSPSNLTAGIDLNSFAQNGNSALFMAASHKQNDMVKLLLSKGANPNSREFQLTETKNDAGFGIIITTNITLLHSYLGALVQDPQMEEMVRLLVEKGADVNAKYDYVNYFILTSMGGGKVTGKATNMAVLISAVSIKNRNVTELLLKNGADPNASYDSFSTTPYGNSNLTGFAPLHAAASVCSPEIAELLLVYGANKNAIFDMGGISGTSTPLQIAKLMKCSAVIEILKNK